MSEQPRLLTQRDGRVLTVTFNNPPRHFFDLRMAIELDGLTRKLRNDNTIGAVVVTGTDRTYMSHIDVPALLRASRALPFRVPYPPARVIATATSIAGQSVALQRILQRTRAADVAFAARTYAVLRRMNTMDKVFITAINGLALGAGCVFALACDIRLAADDDRAGDRRFALATRREATSLITTVTSRQARQKIRAYHDWLEAHPDLPDEVIESGLGALLNSRTPLSHRGFGKAGIGRES